MQGKQPRVVLITRKSEYELLLERHGTRAQASFFLATRGRTLESVWQVHERQLGALNEVSALVPGAWRRARVDRHSLNRFLFEPDDIVVAVGQDGLIANLAKYLDGQVVIGVNPDPRSYDGVLVRHAPEVAGGLLLAAERGAVSTEERTMVVAETDDGQRLWALNEIFVGHRTHQSARYRIRHGEHSERQSSSGAIVATGTGATGWARSIALSRKSKLRLPAPTDGALCFFVREAFPSVTTGTNVVEGRIETGTELCVLSEMNEGGVIFGDGIEDDRIELGFGVEVRLAVAERRLRLALGA